MTNENMIDLHAHSYCSDGTFSPEGLVILAKKEGLSALALTDHDTIDGLKQFHAAGKAAGIETVSGIEFGVLSPMPPYKEIHILGLDFDETHKEITDSIAFIQNARMMRNEEMCQKLTRLGLPVSLEEVTQNAGGEIITRAHFANVMLQKGYIDVRNEAFSKYISSDMPGYVEREFLSAQKCIEIILQSGGAAVLAHPTLYHLGMDEIEKLCIKLKKYGLTGVEVQHSAYTKGEAQQLEKIAIRTKLAKSGGSDFHGENKPGICLGVGKGNLKIPYSYLDGLRLAVTSL